MIYIKKKFDGFWWQNIYLKVDSLVEINDITAGSNNITLRKVNVRPYGLDNIYGQRSNRR